MALRGSHTGGRCKRENELNSITDRLLEPGPESLAERLENLRAIAMEHLAKLRKLVSHPESIEQTRAVLAEHFGTFKLEPVNEQGKSRYRAHGSIDFFGDRAVRERVVPGARIELATPAFSGRRSTNELPRHI